MPDEITTLFNLKTLRIENNNFTNSLPNEIGNTLKLQVLRLDRNHFSGHIPQSLVENAPNFQVVDYSNNDFN